MRHHHSMLRRGFLAIVLGLASASSAVAGADPFTTSLQPANAIVMPFDAKTRDTTLLVSNVAGLTPADGGGFIAGITTHWVFWSQAGKKLAAVSICLTINDTIVVDPKAVSNIDVGNNPIGTLTDLSGSRGFVVVTAFATDEICSPADQIAGGPTLVDYAIVGGFSIFSDGGTELTGNGVGLATDPSGEFTDLPNFRESLMQGGLDLQTLEPESLDSSLVVLIGLREHRGPFAGELGPLKRIKAQVTFFDTFEIPTSLPDLSFDSVKFTSLVPQQGSLLPASVSYNSSGLVRLSGLLTKNKPIGFNSFLYAFVGSRIGTANLSLGGRYLSN